MTRKKVYLILQSLLCALIAGWLALSAVRMVLEGEAAQTAGGLFDYSYTRDKAAERLMPMLPLIFIAVGMTVAGWILNIRDEGAGRPVRDLTLERNLICARVQSPDDAMRRERSIQQKLTWIGWGAFAVCMLPLLLYAANGAHFDRPLDTEADLFMLLRVLVPCSALGIAALSVTGILTDRHLAREIDAARARAAAEREDGTAAAFAVKRPSAVAQDAGRGMWILRAAVLALAAALIISGIRNGGLEDVLTKANAICMECIGLG